MADVPLIFSARMIGALLDGRKTMTRRLDVARWRSRPVGTRVWVRENWWQVVASDGPQAVAPGESAGREGAFYRADWLKHPPCLHYRGRPSIHMPRWASRLTLIVESVKVERLQDISEAGALAEGCVRDDATGRVFESCASMRVGESEWTNARDWYADLWRSLHGADAWAANPWVAAITFRTIHSNIDALGGADCPLTGDEVAR